ncbi:MAG: hypothetical protein HYU37_12290 [Acidobacteria bacterium]|nr:hypothetical protein [Acidobacteriota bacterium]
MGLGFAAVEPFLPSPYAPRIHVGWENGVSSDERLRLELAFRLARPEHLEGTAWRYDLVDPRPETVAALIAHPAVKDTHEIDRTAGVVQPGAPRGTTWIRPRALHFWRVPSILAALATASAAAALLSVAWLVLTRQQWSRRACLLTSAGLLAAGAAWHAISSVLGPTVVALVAAAGTAVFGVANGSYRVTAKGATLVAIVWAAAIALIGGTSVVRAAAACGVVYTLGYVPGALLVPPRDDDTALSLAPVRTIAGLLLSTMGFFLCLRLSVPWVIGPVALLLAAVMVHGRAAFTPPRPAVTPSWDAVIVGLAAVIAFAPILIAAARMSSGQFPPVFFNVGTPYFLGHVHSLVKTTTFPPPSLSFLDGRRSYHYGIHGLAALISRSSGLAPHHTLFLVVLPLLTVGVVAAAVVLARRISPQLPSLVSIPMLLVSVPTFWYQFWGVVGPRVREAASAWTLSPLHVLMRQWDLWGVASNNAHNIAAHFLVLACLAGIAAAPTRGWRLPIFLAGVAFIVKAPTGVSLLAGLALLQAVRATTERSFRSLMPALAAVAVFGAVYIAFWVIPGQESGLQLFPLYQVKVLSDRGRLATFGADVVWLLLPALIALTVGLGGRDRQSPSLLLFAVASFIVANTFHASIAVGVADDWLQIMIAVPLFLRAFVLSVAGQRWTRFSRGVRVAFLCAVALAIVPPLVAAASYAALLIRDPQNGHEFADNRLLGEALAVIPTEHTTIVTNDLRYPADRFQHDNRQMQIPALFGHQAFAVNYEFESYPFSEERRTLQELLRATEWTDAIERAAQKYHWTHLVVHKHYAHPAAIPLERLFDNDAYTVFRFSAAPPTSAPAARRVPPHQAAARR